MPHTINVGARSLFVTTTAWVFIILAVLALAMVAPPAFADPAFGPGNKGGGQGNSGPHKAPQVRAARSGEINEYDANDEGRFDAFTQGDNKS